MISNRDTPYWLSPGYRHALLRDSIIHFQQGITSLSHRPEARYSLGQGMRLLLRYMMRWVHIKHLLKYETIWEILRDAPRK